MRICSVEKVEENTQKVMEIECGMRSKDRTTAVKNLLSLKMFLISRL